MSKDNDLLAEIVGRENEQKALAVVRELYEEAVFPFDTESPPPELTFPGSSDDDDGIDLWVPTLKGLVGIQIKSSRLYADDFTKKHRNGKVIPAVVINEKMTAESMKRDLLAAIIWAMGKWYPES